MPQIERQFTIQIIAFFAVDFPPCNPSNTNVYIHLLSTGNNSAYDQRHHHQTELYDRCERGKAKHLCMHSKHVNEHEQMHGYHSILSVTRQTPSFAQWIALYACVTCCVVLCPLL